MSSWNVGDIMTAGVVPVRQEAPLREVLDAVTAGGAGAAPVVDADGRVIGMIAETDLLTRVQYAAAADRRRLLQARKRRCARTKAAGAVAVDLMTAPAVTVQARTAVAVAARLMTAAGAESLPVVDEAGRLAGVVSRPDLIKIFLYDEAATGSR